MQSSKSTSEAIDAGSVTLSIICVNWNSLAYLRECIASIYHFTQGIVFEIIVVDNASPEGGIETIHEQFSSVHIIKSEQNLGFAGANNLGFRASRGKYVLLLNPDTRLISPTINILIGSIESLPDAGIVGCKMLNTNLSVQITSIQKFPTILNQILDAEYLRLRWPGCPIWDIGPLFSEDIKIKKVDVIPGACMLMRREVFERVGLLSEDYFMYAEDLDLNYKLKRAGYTNYYVGETAIIHHGGGSSSRHNVSYWATVMQCKAMVQYFRKTRGRGYELLYKFSIASVALCRLGILYVLSLFGERFWDRRSREQACKKWKAVFHWALDRRNALLRAS